MRRTTLRRRCTEVCQRCPKYWDRDGWSEAYTHGCGLDGTVRNDKSYYEAYDLPENCPLLMEQIVVTEWYNTPRVLRKSKSSDERNEAHGMV